MKKIIYPYIRFSSAEQTKGDSLRRQLTAISKYAAENDFEINEEHRLIDMAVSGYTGKNREEDAGLGRFLLAIEEGVIPVDGSSYLCIEQLDRLSREEIDIAFNFFSTILRKNVNIITLMDSKIYTKNSLKSITDIIYSLSIMQQSHTESEKKSVRIKASFEGRLEKIRSGGNAKYASQLPNWIEESSPKSGKFYINEHGELIKRIFKMALDDTPLNQIARILNKEDIKRPTRKTYIQGSGIWTGGTISHIIKNKCAFGLLELKKFVPIEIEEKDGETEITYKRVISRRMAYDSVPNYYPAVITESEFNVANSRVKERKQTKERGRSTDNNLFTSLLYCGECKQRMHFDLSKKKLKSGIRVYKNLRCSSHRFKKRTCNSLSINYEMFEKSFPLIIFMSGSFNEIKLKKEKERLEEELISKEAEYIKRKEKIENIEDEIIEQNVDISIYISLINKLKSEANIAKDELERVRSE